MTKVKSTSKTARKQYTPEFHDEALKLAEKAEAAIIKSHDSGTRMTNSTLCKSATREN